jgi:hypothetical protein
MNCGIESSFIAWSPKTFRVWLAPDAVAAGRRRVRWTSTLPAMYDVRELAQPYVGGTLTRINRTHKKHDVGVLPSKFHDGAVFRESSI